MKCKYIPTTLTALIAMSTLALAARPTPTPRPTAKDNLTVTALPSTNGVVPTSPGPMPHVWFYAFCLPSGADLNDTLHIRFQDTDGNGIFGEIATVSFSANGNPALTSGITVPPTEMLDDQTNNDVTVDVPLFKSGLADGTYQANLLISVSPQSGFTLTHDTIHIQVTVGGPCGGEAITCFFTDSNFLDLVDCNGDSVTGDSGGTFQIVTNNRGIATATNPGQFYYNMLWSNTTGSDQDVTVNLNATNLNPSNTNSIGHPIAQAAHAATFNTAGFDPNFANWDFVNTGGQPCGPSGPCTMTVPAGDTLFVTWHLVWNGIGLSAGGYSTDCNNANAPVDATGQVTGDSIQPASCTATATGYRKR